jgi:hypothetical protein
MTDTKKIIHKNLVFLWRLGQSVLGLLRIPLLFQRLKRLKNRGVINGVPNVFQLALGSWIMTKYWNIALAYAYHEKPKHVLWKRFLTDPTTMLRPLGMLASKRSVITHLFTVDHGNPKYDFDLLFGSEKGGMYNTPRETIIEEFMAELDLLVRRVHPRQVEYESTTAKNPHYFEQLQQYSNRYFENPKTEPILRDTVLDIPHFYKLNRIFGDLPGAMDYFLSLPKDPISAYTYLKNFTPTILEDYADTLQN